MLNLSARIQSSPNGLPITALPRPCVFEGVESSSTASAVHTKTDTVAYHGEVLFTRCSQMLQAAAQPTILAPLVCVQALAVPPANKIPVQRVFRDGFNCSEHNGLHSRQSASDDESRALHVGLHMPPQPVWNENGVRINFHRPISVFVSANVTNGLPCIDEKPRVPGRTV